MFRRSLSTSVIPAGHGNSHRHEDGRHEDGHVRFKEPLPKRQGKSETNLYVLGAIAGMAILILISAAFTDKSSRGPCPFEHALKRHVCKTKELTIIPATLNPHTASLHFGTTTDKNDNHFTLISRENFSNYHQVEELVLVKCGIETIQDGAFYDLNKLQRLDLRFNRIQSLTESTFSGIVSLDHLLLSNNPLIYLADSVFHNMRIDLLVLGNNPTLASLTEDVFKSAVIKTLIFNRCNLSELKPGLLKPLAQSLQEFQLNNNLKSIDIPEKFFSGSKLEKLSLVENGITDNSFLEYVSTDELYLDGNPLEHINFDIFPNLHKLKVLSLKRTSIKDLPEKAFHVFDDLRELNLDGNLLNFLDVEQFTDLEDLKILRLTGNRITAFIGNFSKDLKHVRSLHVDRNQIQTLPTELEILLSHISNITIGSNPLHCNCEMVWFHKWLDVNKHRIRDIQDVTCETPVNGKLVELKEEELKCRSPNVVNATIGSDGVELLCEAEGDPAPDVMWVDPMGKETTTARKTKVSGRTLHRVTLIKEGNYSCIAENIAGTDEVVLNSRDIQHFGNYFGQTEKIKILETPKGFLIAAALVCLLGYIFRHQ